MASISVAGAARLSLERKLKCVSMETAAAGVIALASQFLVIAAVLI